MSTSQLDPSFVIRLAIALAALKHKPLEQSTASYLLDLQTCFPLQGYDGRACAAAGHADDDSGSTPVDTRAEWRTYALELEKQLTTLKGQRDADQELLSRLRHDEPQSDTAPPKKRRKKTQSSSKDRHEAEWNWDQSRADWANVLTSQHPPPPSLIEAYLSLKGCLASSNVDNAAYASRLSDAIHRALETIHVFMFSQSYPIQQQSEFPITPAQLKPEHIDSARIAMVSPLLMHLLRVVFPSLIGTIQGATKSKRPRPSQRPVREMMQICIDRVLDRLLECVLLPLLRALAPLCVARLASLIPPPASKRSAGRRENSEKKHPVSTKQADVHTDVFALLGMSLAALDALPFQPQTNSGTSDTKAIAPGIRERLGLETIRELEALYADPRSSRPRPPSPTPSVTTGTVTDTERRAKQLEKLVGTRAERVYALARRDAAWLLTSILNLCVSQMGAQQDSTVKGECSELLREALLDRIGKLVRSADVGGGGGSGDSDSDHWTRRNRFGVDAVCRNHGPRM